MLTTSMTQPHDMDVSGVSFPIPSMESDGSFSNWTDGAFGDSMLEPDPNILDGLGLHSLQQPAFASWVGDHRTGQSYDVSSAHSQTPSLTISPFTSSISDFDSFGGETDKMLSPSMAMKDDRGALYVEKSNMKRKQALKTKSAAVKRHLKKGFDGGKTPATHPIECRECGMRFRQQGELRKHEKAVHRSKGQRPHACSHCDKKFNWPKDVKRHEERVHKKAITGIGHRPPNLSFDPTFTGDGPPEYELDSEMLVIPATDFQLFIDDDDYIPSFDPPAQQDRLCENNNPDHNTFSRTHSPGEGSAPHRGARV